MIEKKYICDICKSDAQLTLCLPDETSRLRFSNEKIYLCHITDTAASERVICGSCLRLLEEAIQRSKTR